MLGQRRRRWANTVPTLAERLVFAGLDVDPMLAQCWTRRRWTNIETALGGCLFTGSDDRATLTNRGLVDSQ